MPTEAQPRPQHPPRRRPMPLLIHETARTDPATRRAIYRRLALAPSYLPEIRGWWLKEDR